MADTVTKWESLGGNNTHRIGGNGYEFAYVGENGETQALQVDYGTLFADKAKTGYEAYMPDLPRSDDILITHGHMDHIGGIAHLLNLKRKELKEKREAGKPLTLHCTKYAEVMIRNSLAGARIPTEEFPEFHTVEDGKPFNVGGFKVEPFAVSHSIPEAVGYVVESPDGVRMMTMGDFKTAPIPLGKGWDDKRVGEVASKGIDFMFLDSTSASSDGMAKGEDDVRKGLREVLKGSEGGMVVSAMIASSAHRLMTVAMAVAEHAKETETKPRTVIIDGASLISARRALTSCGYDLEKMVREATGVQVRVVASNTRIAQDTPANEKFCVCTGTQSEEASFLKIAEGRNKNISIEGVGCPVYVYNLQSCIPGNEEKYEKLEQKFIDKGCKTFFPSRYKENKYTVHASGHAGAGDVARACSVVGKNSPRPTKVVPIHGSGDQRKKVMEIAQNAGLKAFIVPNFAAINVAKDGSVNFTKPSGQETWIGISDKNNDFRRPNYEYDRVVLDMVKKNTYKAETLKYPRPQWKKKEEQQTAPAAAQQAAQTSAAVAAARAAGGR